MKGNDNALDIISDIMQETYVEISRSITQLENDTFDTLSDSDEIIPETVMQDREKQRLLREIIDNSLTEMQKLCIIAYYFQEQKQSEIASELGIPKNTVKTNLSRAKQKIKDGVLELEKKNGTRLYSVAPLLLLLFKEDVDAAVIPDAVTAGVYTAIRQSVAAANMANAAATTDMGNAC